MPADGTQAVGCNEPGLRHGAVKGTARGEFTPQLSPRQLAHALWVERLAQARHIATYRVALHVLYQNWKRGGTPFALSNSWV